MRHLRSPILAGYLAVTLGLTPAWANPLGGQVVGGSATIQGQGTGSTTINQTSDRAIINWDTFNIGAGETTRFNQLDANSIALNRVTGGLGASQIFGTLSANGRVFLVNPNGILFGQGAVVDTAGFLATTNDIKNDDFMAGRMNFTIPGNPAASVVNLGTITAHSGGIAALVAPGVRNAGTITADLGKVALASGNGFTLDFYGDKMITLQVGDAVAAQVIDVSTGQPLNALVKNEGTLKANGGRVELSAVAARQVVDAVINNTGVIEANSVGTKNGMIVLGAATAATKGAGNGYAQKVKVSGRISASGKNAGEKGGKIVVTGEHIALAGATIDASGAAGGGKVLIGGDVGGGKGNAAVAGIAQAALEGEAIATASTVTVDGASLIDVSATERGNGGKAVIWSDRSTSFAGAIHGRGGSQGGDGGFAEVSSKGQLSFTGFGDLSALAGRFGTLLLDPRNLYVNADGVAPGDDPGSSAISAANLLDQLSRNGVILTTSLPGSQDGNITIAVQLAWSAATTLTLAAANNIAINAAITASNLNGGLTINAGGAISATAAVNVGTFTLQNGAWRQVGTGDGIPAFSAHDFRIVAGSFLRALGGSGTSSDPYRIADLYGLQGIASAALLGKSFQLANDIDANGTKYWNGGDGFKSIGSGQAAFTGRLDGKGFEIGGLTINSTSQYVGLFGYLGKSAVITDIGLVNADITSAYSDPNSYAHVGVLAGYNAGGTISHAYATGSVSSGSIYVGSNVGGLVGTNTGAIEDSYANVAITVAGSGSSVWAGGLVGENVGTIARSYAEGAVDGAMATGGSNKFGGLVGYNALGIISRSYALGAVAGNAGSVVGGLVGDNSGSIIETYASGAVGGGTRGGLVGANYGIVTSSYWDTGTSGLPNAFGSNIMPSLIASATGLTTDAARDQTSYAGWNFGANGAWFMIPGFTRPFLRTEWSQTVRNAHQLQLMAMNLGASYTLRNDILDLGQSLANASGMWGPQGFASIAGNGYGFFNGSFDGRGHTISGLRIAPTSSGITEVGLFGAVGHSGVVQDVHLTNVTIAATGGSQSVGAIAGSNFGRIDRVSAIGTVGNAVGLTAEGRIQGSYGGLVGSNWAGGTVTDSWADVAVVAHGPSNGFIDAGGLVGFNSGGIVRSYTTGAVSGSSSTSDHIYVGGLVGLNYGLIDDSHATGAVTSNGYNGRAGGLVAVNDGGDIVGSYATGSVMMSGNAAQAGGLVGENKRGGSIAQSYYAIGHVNVSGAGSIAGGLVGYNDHSSSIDTAWARGNVTAGADSWAGGLVGVNEGTLSNVFAYGNVVAGNSSTAGGLVGESTGSIDTASASGNVTAGSDSLVGGLVGFTNGMILGAFAEGDVTAGAGSYVGGLVGWAGSSAWLVGVDAYGRVSSTGAGSAIGGVAGRNDGVISFANYIAPDKGVYGTSDSFIGGLVGINNGVVADFTVDPPVVGDGPGNTVGGAVGSNTGTLQDGDVTADVVGGSGGSAGIITGANSGTVSEVTGSGSVNGAPVTTDPPPVVDPPPPIQLVYNFTDANPNPTPTQVDLTQSSDGQGGGPSGPGGGGPGNGGGGNGGAGNNPPPTGGPPPGPGLARTMSEQRFSGVPPIGENRFVSNEVVVQVASTVTVERVREIARSLGMSLIASQTIDSTGRVVYRFATGNGGDVRAIIRALERNNVVASAQPNYVFNLAQASAAPVLSAPAVSATPAEAPLPSAAPPAGGDAADVTGSLPPKPELSDADLQSDMAARTTLPAGDAAQYIIGKLKLGAVHTRAVGRNISVAVIDSEIDVQHPDLQGVVSERFDATGAASNPHAHGTGMAGAIASKHRLLGIAPGVRIYAIKAFDETSSSAEATSFQILKGLDWAIAKNVRIINMSFAGPRDLMMERALQKATDQGIVLIAAAGNAGPKSPPLYPAADPNVIAVSATDYADKPFAMANRGKYIAVAAPGVDVLVPSPKGGYQLTTGTSVAAAHVSGVAALLLESRPKLTPKDVRAILTSTAKPINLKGRDDVTGAGLVDPFQALTTLSARSAEAAPETQVTR